MAPSRGHFFADLPTLCDLAPLHQAGLHLSIQRDLELVKGDAIHVAVSLDVANGLQRGGAVH